MNQLPMGACLLVCNALKAQTTVWSPLCRHAGPRGLSSLTHVLIVAVIHMLPEHVPTGAAVH